MNSPGSAQGLAQHLAQGLAPRGDGYDQTPFAADLIKAQDVSVAIIAFDFDNFWKI